MNLSLYNFENDSTIRIWNATSRQELKLMTTNKSRVYCLAYLGDDLLAGGYGDNSIQIWNVKTGKLLRDWNAHTSSYGVLSLKVMSSGVLVSGGGDKKIKIWNITEGRELNTLNGNFFNLIILQS